MEPRYPETGEFQISNSDVETFLRCQYLYWKRRASRRRIVTVPMAIGTAVARAAEYDNQHKAQGYTVPLSDLAALAVQRYVRETEENEVQNAAKFNVDQSRDDVVEATRSYHRVISPAIEEPILVEAAIIADLGNGIHLAGRLDAAQESLVRDLKTGQPWDQRRTDRSRQLTAYDILYEAHFGESPRRVAIDTVSRWSGGKKLWRAKTIWSSRCERDRTAYVETVSRVKTAMEAGSDLPAPEGAWWCSASHCEMWQVCDVRPGA